MKVVLCVLLLPGLLDVRAGQTREDSTSNDAALTDYLLQVLEIFIHYMPVGIPELGIPSLDPFNVPSFDIPTINQPYAVIDLDFEHLVLEGLSGLTPILLDASFGNLTLLAHMAIPHLKATAEYKLDGKLFGVIPLNGGGACRVETENINIVCHGKFKLAREQTLQLNSLVLDANFSAIHINFENLMGGDNLGNSINNLLSSLGVTIFHKLKPLFIHDITDAIYKVINDQLNKVNVEDIITGQTSPSTY